ncbi:hypothetical protein BG004_006239 [Podila humilis]|nr:hypothetical protein BG004_006239 [Podila humilis]
MKSTLILTAWAAVLATMAAAAAPEVAVPYNSTLVPGDDIIPVGTPMKSIPIHLFRRGSPTNGAQRERTLRNFQPQNSLELRFIEADKYDSYDACHHVDMAVELKTDDGKRTIKALNPYAFQHAVESITCSVPAKGGRPRLHLKLSPEYARQARRQWKMSSKTVFGIVIPHDHVDLQDPKTKECYTDLSAQARKQFEKGPMETIVKLVKTPLFDKNNVITMSVVRTDIWTQMNREQGVQIYHKPMEEEIAHLVSNRMFKRGIANESGPMWDFNQDMSAASKEAAKRIKEKNVQANMDRSSVKGYAQANMAWKQTCFRNIFTGNMNCFKWGISSSQIQGMTQINHQTRVRVQAKTPPGKGGRRNGPERDDSLLTLTDIKVASPSLTLLPSTALLGFAVPGVFDLGATAEIHGSVALAILVQASEDLLVNTGSAASCPWTVDWNGSITSVPTIKFGTCTLPGMPKMAMSGNDVRFNGRGASAIHGRGGPIAENDFYFGLDPDSPRNQRKNGIMRGLAPSSRSRQTAAVTVGLTVKPGVHLGLKVVGISGMTAGLVAPLSLNINSKWDTQKTEQCPANSVAVNADGNAALELVTGFFGFDRTIPVVASPHLVSPSACIRL